MLRLILILTVSCAATFLANHAHADIIDEYLESLKTPGAEHYLLRSIGSAYSSPGGFQNWVPSADGQFMTWETHAYWDTNFDMNAVATITYKFNTPFAINTARLGLNSGNPHLMEVSANGTDWAAFQGGGFWSPTDISSTVSGSSEIWLRGSIVGYERFLHFWQNPQDRNFLLVANSAVVPEPSSAILSVLGLLGCCAVVRSMRARPVSSDCA